MPVWEDSSRQRSLSSKSRRRVSQAFDSPPPFLRELEGDSWGLEGDSCGIRRLEYTPVEIYVPVGYVPGVFFAHKSRALSCFVRRRVVGVGVEEFSSGAGSWSVVVVGGLRLVVVGAASGLRGRCFALGVLSVCSI